MDFQYKEMGMRIKKRRKELHLSQSTLAESLGISNNHLSSIENGKEKASLDVFVLICNILQVTPDYLLLGSLHSKNVPQNIYDMLRMCSQDDIIFAQKIVELLVERNTKTRSSDNHFLNIAYFKCSCPIKILRYQKLTQSNSTL